MLKSEKFFYCVRKSPPPVRNLRHMNVAHKVTVNVPKITGPYRQPSECSLQRHTLGPQNDPFHLVWSPILKTKFLEECEHTQWNKFFKTSSCLSINESINRS